MKSVTSLPSLENLSFRKASLADVEALVPMINLSYRRPPGEVPWKTEGALLSGLRTNAASLTELITAEDKVILVLNLPDASPISLSTKSSASSTVVGCVLLEKLSDFAYLGMLTIHADFQNMGLSKELLRHAENFVTNTWHLNKIKMTVIGQRTELISYYQRFGYSLTGQQEAFPCEDQRFGKPLRPDLYFEVLKKDLRA